MKKRLPILSFTLGIFLFGVEAGSSAQPHKNRAYSKSDVSVVQTISAARYAADGKPMVIVTVSIKKDAYKGGVGRIEETFPSNMQAMLISSGFATFQGGNGKAEFIWNSVPQDRQINVSYAIVATSSSTDSKTVAGQFYYQNQSFKINPASFTLKVDPSLASQPAVPTNTSTLDDLYYSVTGSYPQSAYTSSVPAATSPPPPNSSATPSNITASASKPAPVEQTQMSASAAPSPQHAATPEPAQPQMGSTSNSSSPQQKTAMSTPENNETASTATHPPAPEMNTAKHSTTPSHGTASASMNHRASAPETSPADTNNTGSASAKNAELVYRVQIIVVGSKLRLHRFFRKHGIKDEVFYDPSDDLPVRVMVGTYPDYKSAKIRCTDLISKGVMGAFVVSYYKGKRISVAQAASLAKH